MPRHPDVVYSIDASDCIVDVNEAWSSFASANAARELLPPDVLGRPLWDFIEDRTTRHLYRLLFERVRVGVGPVRFAFRCDGPTVRRHLQMTIEPDSADFLSMTVATLVVEERPGVLLLDRRAHRGRDLLRMCSWCKKIPDSNGEWIEIDEALSKMSLFEDLTPPAISHTMCETCHGMVQKAIEDPEFAASGRLNLGALTAA